MNIRRVSGRFLGITAVGILAFGLGVGGAAAVVAVIHTPTGVSVAPGVDAVPIPAPTYSMNAAGLTFGSAAQAANPGQEPDLIQATATNGVHGYVFKNDLEDADGTTAQKAFKTPEDALKWQATEGQVDHSVPVYLVDGKTQVGVFVVEGAKSQAAAAAQVKQASSTP